MNRLAKESLLAVALIASVAACGGGTATLGAPDGGSALAQTLLVAHEGVLASSDIATGQERPGAIQGVAGPTDLQVLEDGTALVNLTARNEVLIVDSRTMLEKARVPSSAQGASRPVHSYISPERNGHRYWIALNDGSQGQVTTNSARFIDVKAGSASYLRPAGEIGLGIGHHKASFSNTVERVVISNIADCDNVLGVYDYSNVSAIATLRKIGSAELGWDGSSFLKTCDPTYQAGVPPAPHGCATSKVSGKAYCNLTASGDLVAIALDATPPTFAVVHTAGSGAGYTKAHPAGRYIYSLEARPREGKGGASCQIGQLVVLDAISDSVVKQLPLFYRGPGCTSVLTGTDEETAEPSHLAITSDSRTLFVTTAGGFGVGTARVRQELVVDLTDPASPSQLPSIPTGTSSGHHGDALSGDGRYLFVANNVDGTVTQIDAAARAVVRTLSVHPTPLTLGTFGSAEGPSEQTGPIR